MEDIVESFSISPTEVSVGVVTFARHAELQWGLGTYNTKATLKTKISELSYARSYTCTGKAMKMMTEEVICPACANYRPSAQRVVVFLTDGNPSQMKECRSPFEVDRTDEMDALKAASDRIIPVGIGQGIATEYLESISWNMPPSEAYILAEYNSLGVILATLSEVACPTLPPTKAPTVAPSKMPTKLPTQAPTSAGGCDASEWAKCDESKGTCSCGDSTCSFKSCGCISGWGCNGAGESLCQVCTSAPTQAPTTFPTAAPSKAPTAQPSNAPTLAPTFQPTKTPTFAPTLSPVFGTSCLPTEAVVCDSLLGVCSKDSGTGTIHCSCQAGYSCNGLGASGCSACTSAPSLAPTRIPTPSPSDAPTNNPTARPSTAPSAAPTKNPTAEPTDAPSFGFGCSPSEVAECDQTSGICFCKDAECSAKQCGCVDGKECSTAACAVCTVAPTAAPSTRVPTSATPTSAPTAPTAAPTYWAVRTTRRSAAKPLLLPPSPPLTSSSPPPPRVASSSTKVRTRWNGTTTPLPSAAP